MSVFILVTKIGQPDITLKQNSKDTGIKLLQPLQAACCYESREVSRHSYRIYSNYFSVSCIHTHIFKVLYTSQNITSKVCLFKQIISFCGCLYANREIDRDGDGRVSYRDFEFMMKYSLEEGF